LLRIPIIFLLLATHQAYAIDVIAHRGYACSEDENSIQSVQRAWWAGADGVEVDVRVSSDGVVYLFHDDEISNTQIAGLSYSEIVSLNNKPISTLFEVLDATNGEGYFVLDLKTNEIAEVDEIIDVVRASHITAQSVSFQSGSLDSLNHIRHRMPSARLTFLSHLKWKIPYIVHPSAKQLVNTLDGRDIDRVSIKGRSFVDKGFIDIIRATGREVHVWTINDRVRAAHYQRLGVDGLITDRVEGLFGDNDKKAYQVKECRTTIADAS
jgi:glycerophosphoryl diester phosphodiesterase